jgi:ribosomal-protein-alanine N-acetyltransferase
LFYALINLLLIFLNGGNFINIRNAEKDDLIKVIEINRRCLPENYSYTFFEAILRDYPKSFFVAETYEGEIVGYVMCRVERVSKISSFRLKKSGHIISIAVIPEYRRMGIGKLLMLNALKSLKEEYGCEESFLEVRVSNKIAIKLYLDLGYKIVDILKSYYIDGEDAYMMSRIL